MVTKQKILFLDIDGVLNGYDFWQLFGCDIASKLRVKEWYRKHTREPFFGVHEEKVKRLAKIVKATGCKVVISSSWRFGLWKTPYSELHEDQKQFIDMMNKYNIEIVGITGRSIDGRREKEIKEWLDKHEDEVYSFVILDDEKADLGWFEGNRLVQTISYYSYKGNRVTGLRNEHVRHAIKILGVKYG